MHLTILQELEKIDPAFVAKVSVSKAEYERKSKSISFDPPLSAFDLVDQTVLAIDRDSPRPSLYPHGRWVAKERLACDSSALQVPESSQPLGCFGYLKASSRWRGAGLFH